jgi:hypothetical protein
VRVTVKNMMDHAETLPNLLLSKKGLLSDFLNKVDWSGCARLLREKRVQGRPHRRKGAEEAPGPPAESEYLEWKSVVQPGLV